MHGPVIYFILMCLYLTFTHTTLLHCKSLPHPLPISYNLVHCTGHLCKLDCDEYIPSLLRANQTLFLMSCMIGCTALEALGSQYLQPVEHFLIQQSLTRRWKCRQQNKMNCCIQVGKSMWRSSIDI